LTNKKLNKDIKPLKRFGQNYLVDKNILAKIVTEINPAENEWIIEIGPGQGALTRFLYERTKNIIAVEIDKRVVENLSSELNKIEILNEDFLELNLTKISQKVGSKLRIAGNIPYNLTSPILFKLFSNLDNVTDAVLMVQYEVALRMTGKKGTKDYGILAVVLRYFAKVDLCFKVSPNVFYPKPNVNSAIVHLHFNNDLTDLEFNELFILTVKACFGNRRKTLKNSLNNSIFGRLDFTDCGIDLTLRAEQLDLKEFIQLTEFIREKKLESGE
jgi:16S rRNA (adenine1518-N6/adenine1519-N6)-dimethyltransferase